MLCYDCSFALAFFSSFGIRMSTWYHNMLEVCSWELTVKKLETVKALGFLRIEETFSTDCSSVC